MNKKIINTLCIPLSLFSVGYASAADVVLSNVSMDYRHEYRLRDRTHYDKLTLATQLPYDYSLQSKQNLKPAVLT